MSNGGARQGHLEPRSVGQSATVYWREKKMLVESDKLTWLTQLRVEEGWVGLTREYSGSCVRVDRSKGRDDIYEVS